MRIEQINIIGISGTTETEIYNGQMLDTKVNIRGEFVISGESRKEFLNRLRNLIEEYRI